MKIRDLIILSVITTSLFSCGPSDHEIVQETYLEIKDYCFANNTKIESGNWIENMNGQSAFSIGKSSIDVEYTNFRDVVRLGRDGAGLRHEISGDLKLLNISSDCGFNCDTNKFYDISIKGKWGDTGEFVLAVEKSDTAAHFFIFSDNEDVGYHYAIFALPEVQFILDKMEKAKQEINN